MTEAEREFWGKAGAGTALALGILWTVFGPTVKAWFRRMVERGRQP